MAVGYWGILLSTLWSLQYRQNAIWKSKGSHLELRLSELKYPWRD
jgi:hypothetical protein